MKPQAKSTSSANLLRAALALLPFAAAILLYAGWYYAGRNIPGLAELLNKAYLLYGTSDASLWFVLKNSALNLLIAAGISCVLALLFTVAAFVYPLIKALFSYSFRVWAFLPLFFYAPLLLRNPAHLSLTSILCLSLIPLLCMRIYAYLNRLNEAQLVKAYSLSANNWLIASRIVLPQALAFLVKDLRRLLPLMMLLVMMFEALAGLNGLGAFVMQHSQDKAVVINVALLIMAGTFFIGAAINALHRFLFPWYAGERA